MIGKISTPYCSPVRTNADNSVKFKTPVLTNQMTGSVINVKNTAVDFRIVSKELSLFREVKSNSNLALLADVAVHSKQSDRFNSVGLAVTMLYNENKIYNEDKNGEAKEKAVGICKKNPRNPDIDARADISVNKRGQEYIHQFLDAQSPLDSTNYALGLRVGSNLKQNRINATHNEQFNGSWYLRLNTAT